MEKFDFSGFATKNDLKCSDGRTIRKDAFKENDGKIVPLVWQHIHDNPTNVLGHALLENRENGVYAFGKFNDTEDAKTAKTLVEHGDIVALSIYANGLIQKGGDVIHGAIREISLVMAGANPGALIDNLVVQHSDGSMVDDEGEAIIYTGEEISMTKEIEHAAVVEKTVQEVFDTLTEEQKNVVYAMIGSVIEDTNSTAAQSDIVEGEENISHEEKGGTEMKKNVFDDTEEKVAAKGTTLSHSQMQEILADAVKTGSLKESILAHVDEYGITNIDYLFPDAKTITPTPDMISRVMDWVPAVINGARHSPFSRIKSLAADITADTARALGYVKGTLKKEEIISLLKRYTTPTTIYKKQKLDRDDIIDITDFDVVSWLKAEMRMMLDEEIARAALIGDGRDAESPDKINEVCIRPIYTDDDMYSHHISIENAVTTDGIIDAIIRSRVFYKGTGNPTLFISTGILTDMLLLKDTNSGRRMYATEAELTSALRISKIVEVPVMTDMMRTLPIVAPAIVGVDVNLIAILVNMNDYVIGADKGGQISMFDDFDIDFNQYKYLMETRCSGALTKPKSAIVIEQIAVAG